MPSDTDDSVMAEFSQGEMATRHDVLAAAWLMAAEIAKLRNPTPCRCHRGGAGEVCEAHAGQPVPPELVPIPREMFEMPKERKTCKGCGVDTGLVTMCPAFPQCGPRKTVIAPSGRAAIAKQLAEARAKCRGCIGRVGPMGRDGFCFSCNQSSGHG